MKWIDDAISNYYQWLKNRTGYCSDDATGWSVINTPFIGLFNDSIDIYIKKENETIFLSDDGETLSNLLQIGVPISRSQKRKDWLNSLLKTYGIRLQDNELCTTATMSTFPQAKHNLISAILGISDLELTSSRNVVSMFQEEVKNYFDELGLIYSPGFITRGDSGLESTFDFQIAGKTQESIIKTFGSLGMNNLPNFLFGWEDIRNLRESVTGKKMIAIAIVDDREKKPKEEFLSALERKNANHLLWSQRDDNKTKDFLYSLAG